MGRLYRRGQGLKVWIAALLLCAPVLSSEKPSGLRPAKVLEIERAVSAEMARLKIPGMSVAVAEDMRLAWSHGFGLADVENGVASDTETVYRIASISKPITAVAVMQLAGKGRLDLDAPIQTYVPGFPVKPWPVTARQLLSHLGGIRHYRSLAETLSTRHYTDLREPLKIFEDDPLVFEPGTRYLYSTFGYCLLGAAVEGASGERFLDYLREHVFTPARMTRTRQDDVYALIPNRARGYQRDAHGGIDNCALSDTSNKIPGGGLLSTAGDLVRFVIALERGELMPARTRAGMFAPARTRDGRSISYGLGWLLLEHGGKRWVGHSGAQAGASSFLLTSPSEGFAVALLANLEGVNLQPLSIRIAGILQETPE